MNLIPVTDITADLPRHSDPKRVYSRRKRDPDLIVVHTTDTETSIEKLAKYDIAPGNHIDPKGVPAITYHAIVMRDGSVFKTLDYNEVAWHAGPWNGKSIGVAMMYKCTDKSGRDIYKPVRVLYDATVKFCASRCLDWGLGPDRVQGHRELLGTGFTWFKGSRVLRKTCPGSLINLDDFRKAVAVEMQTFLVSQGFYTGPVDGQFGPVSRAAMDTYRRSL